MKSNSVVFETPGNSEELGEHAATRVEPRPDEVHLWYEVLDAHDDQCRTDLGRSWLTPEEWERCQRFAFEEGRRECLAARLMVRAVLSRCAGAPPAAWRFRASALGRPEVDGPDEPSPLRFNLSHAGGVVACVVSAHYDVGVDVERVDRHMPLTLAESRFAPSEIRALQALPDSARPRRFLEYWTLKEAYVKARGDGLSLPLDRFAFDVERPGRPRVVFEAGFDQESHWQFDRLAVGTDHLVAVATRRGERAPLRLVVHEFRSADELQAYSLTTPPAKGDVA